MKKSKDSMSPKDSEQICQWGTAKITFGDNTLEETIEKDFLKIIRLSATIIDDKEPPYHGHSERVAQIATAIGREMGCSLSEIKNIRLSAFLHDIGKVGISESILKKTTLSAEEIEEVRRNHIEGTALLKNIQYLKDCISGIFCLRERFDGKGYPAGLKGEEIPLSSRILAVSETFDAMRSCRLFRKGLSIKACLAEIEECAGSQFDPEVTVAFHSCIDKGKIKKEVEVAHRIKNLEAHYLTEAISFLSQRPVDEI